MRGIVLNEYEILNEALEQGIVRDKSVDTVSVLARHYFSQNLDEEYVFNIIEKFMSDNCPDYDGDTMSDYMKGFVDHIYNSQRYNLVNIQAITISESEWQRIIQLNDKKAEKLAFVMLVYQKITEIKKPKSSGWINVEVSDILLEAGFKSQRENIKEFNPLYINNYIGLKTLGLDSILINYRDIEEQSKPKIIITNFTKIITYYDEHKNGVKYKECEVCGRRFKLSKNDYSSKYCSKCKKTVRNDKQKKIMSKKRNKSKMLA